MKLAHGIKCMFNAKTESIEKYRRFSSALQLLFTHRQRHNSKMNESTLNAELNALLERNDFVAEQFLRNYVRRVYFRRCIKWFVVALAIAFAIYWVPTLTWNATAIGRLALINLVLPFYNWEEWTNVRCLIESSETTVQMSDEHGSDSNSMSSEECSTCENLLSIDRKSNLTYDRLQSNYLWRYHPVIIVDSHSNWLAIHNGLDFIEFMNALPDLMRSEPCNVASNLLAKSATVQKIIRQAERFMSHEEWFFHFRNCESDAIKASRIIVPYHRRPYYLPNHLPPFRSSWILASHQYETASTFDSRKSNANFDPKMHAMKQLNVRDLVIVMQLQGEIIGRLEVNTVCADYCTDHTFRLIAGQSIVFSARFWNLYYEPIATVDDDQHNYAITFITEFESY